MYYFLSIFLLIHYPYEYHSSYPIWSIWCNSMSCVLCRSRFQSGTCWPLSCIYSCPRKFLDLFHTILCVHSFALEQCYYNRNIADLAHSNTNVGTLNRLCFRSPLSSTAADARIIFSQSWQSQKFIVPALIDFVRSLSPTKHSVILHPFFSVNDWFGRG